MNLVPQVRPSLHTDYSFGVLSPVSFCRYIDGLLTALSQAGVGCFVGDHFIGALAYADDISSYGAGFICSTHSACHLRQVC
jgi:hypothetical protein